MKKLIFWLVWLVLVIPVFVYYLISDFKHRRWPPSCFFKTGLVYHTVYGKMILGKS